MFSVTISNGTTAITVETDQPDHYSPDVANDCVARAVMGLVETLAVVRSMEDTDIEDEASE